MKPRKPTKNRDAMQADEPVIVERPNTAPVPPGPGLNPNALTVDSASQLLSKVGGQPVTQEMLQADIEDGAPTNADGTINLLHYAAWLVREMADAG